MKNEDYRGVYSSQYFSSEMLKYGADNPPVYVAIYKDLEAQIDRVIKSQRLYEKKEMGIEVKIIPKDDQLQIRMGKFAYTTADIFREADARHEK